MQKTIWPEDKNYLSAEQQEKLLQCLQPILNDWLQQRQLPAALWGMVEALYLPLGAYLAREIEQKGCRILGLSGGQGAGKSTLSGLLVEILAHGFGKKAVTFSLDDIYLSHSERLQLAHDIHPLLATRGVPGTHDPLLGLHLLQQLRIAENGDVVYLPVFDKAIDDRLPPEQWRIESGPFDLIIFEGWCVGAMPQTEDELLEPINALERHEDADGIWRRFVNDELTGPYIDLFANLDMLLMIKVPGMEQVFKWRLRQEEQLLHQHTAKEPTDRIMGKEAIDHFIQHYERITRSMLTEMPERADLVLALNKQQQVETIQVRGDN